MPARSRWNFTVSQLELLLIEGEGEEEGDFSCQLERDRDEWSIHVSDTSNILYLSDRFALPLG